jgi:hypothetical protein
LITITAIAAATAATTTACNLQITQLVVLTSLTVLMGGHGKWSVVNMRSKRSALIFHCRLWGVDLDRSNSATSVVNNSDGIFVFVGLGRL